jgi:hypothetical protein
MTNQRNSENPLNDDVCDREAHWRAEFQGFQQTIQQEVRQKHRRKMFLWILYWVSREPIEEQIL